MMKRFCRLALGMLCRLLKTEADTKAKTAMYNTVSDTRMKRMVSSVENICQDIVLCCFAKEVHDAL